MHPQMAVIFDVDGVLIDSYQPHYQSWVQLFLELGVEFTEQQFRATFGRTNRDIFTELFPGEMSEGEMRARGERKEVLYREIISSKLTPMPGAVELVQALDDEGFALGVGSSGPPENIALTLEKLELTGLISAAVTGADVERGKPDPQVFLMCAERLERDPALCAVVEDAPQGVEAANRAGMTSIGLTSTQELPDLAMANLVVQRLDELTPLGIATLIAAVGASM